MGNINLLLSFKIWLTTRKYQIYEGRNSLRERVKGGKKIKKTYPRGNEDNILFFPLN